MLYINKLSDAAIQQVFLTGNAGQRIDITFRYLPSQQMWSMDVVYDDFELRGAMVLNSVDMLQNYRNILPFGISCFTTDGQDPYDIGDFSNGYAKLYLLTNDEADYLQDFVF